ncbi:transporter substrate-binding domain-containing protein [Pseudoalteromonas sp. McH1-7]|uniref:substrate-binding periplasmic protein n=1 Tax=Pseudoalteromonas TaxID=53246 RepID=UPI001591012A|nr:MULTISPECIES: transporter substrate-binding domain-containing protein [Pseudoalteromonas]MDW7548500.1 transporter substrate-binding domain-containing protein [Pseudoalteromonas peptidolytica]NUZ12240.1 transporter substrate-binding domain-containing protein [Pseudoalteromonas sp. McH1-7]USD30751.1 transporter substrate-binding domain-containing protein [Pseudoalteromonas sp. SCSIO 43201]
MKGILWFCMGTLVISFCAGAFTLNIVTENFPDFQYQNEKGELIGRAADKVKTVLDDAGIKYTINVLTWPAAYNAALRKDDTCVFSTARNNVRENEFEWVFPIDAFTTSFYGLRENEIELESLEDAKRYRTAVIRDNFSHQFLMEHGFIEGKQLLIINSFDKVFELLNTRKDFVDLVVLSDAQFRFRRTQEQTAYLLEPVYTLDDFSTSLYFACNKNVPKYILNKIHETYQSHYSVH